MSHRKKRTKLWEADPHCHWCGVETVIPTADGRHALNTATLDHLYSKWELRNNPDLKQQILIACASCNEQRGREAEREWLLNYREETRRITNPRMVRLGEILARVLNAP